MRIEGTVEGPRLAPAGALQIDRVRLEGAIAVAREVNASWRRVAGHRHRPTRGLVAPVAVGQITNCAGREVECEEVVRSIAAEGRTIRREHDRLSIRTDRGIDVLVTVGRETLESTRPRPRPRPGPGRITRVCEPQTIQIGIAGHGQPAEHDTLAVGRPGGGEDRNQLGELIATDDPAPPQIPEKERVALRIPAAERRYALAVHVDPRLEEMEGLELLAALALDYRALRSSIQVLRVDRRVAARGREEEERGRRIARELVRGRFDGEDGQFARADCERRLTGDDRVIALAHPVLPLLRQLFEPAAIHAGDRVIEAPVFPDVVVQLDDPPLAIARGEEAMDDATHRIDETPVRILELRQRRQPPRDRHVTEDHLIAAVLTRREEFRETLCPPQRYARLPNARIASERLGGEAQLKDVDQLVANRVPEFGVAATERQRHTPFQEFRDAEQAFGRNERQDVGLLEIGMRSVDDEGNAPRHRVIEAPLEVVVALFRVGKRHAPELFLFRIVVQVDVFAAQDAPVELAILDLVLAEVAELRRQEGGACNGGHGDDTA